MATPASTELASVEGDLDALLVAVKNELATKKNEMKTVRGRVRQVARRRRHKRRREIRRTVSAVAPRAVAYGTAIAGFVAFALGLAFLSIGNLAAALTLFTVAGAAWGMGAVVRR